MTIYDLTRLYPEGVTMERVRVYFNFLEKSELDSQVLQEIRSGKVRLRAGLLVVEEHYLTPNLNWTPTQYGVTFKVMDVDTESTLTQVFNFNTEEELVFGWEDFKKMIPFKSYIKDNELKYKSHHSLHTKVRNLK